MHVVEGTTSLSNLFRTLDRSVEKIGARKIGIRNLTPKVNDQPDNLSLNSVISEREELLEKARKMIEEEKENMANQKKTADDAIASQRKAWEDEKLILQQEAYEEGFQIGFGEGRGKAISEMTTSVQTANEITEKSLENAKQYQASQERIILELAMQTATRIIGETIEEDEEKFLSVIRRALKEVREMKEIKLYVSIDYFKLVSDNRTELASIFPPDIPFLVFANDDFDSTECYIETNHGRVVVSIDDQLNHLREQLIELLESGN